MVEIAKEKNLSKDEQESCFIIGYNHDIGYEFAEDTSVHNFIGGNLLKSANFKYWEEIYYHGEINPNFSSKYLDILNMADMQIDKYGNDIGYDKRLEDIGSRYGFDSKIFIKAKTLINLLRKKD